MLAQTVPIFSYLAPYARETGAFFSNLRSATNYVDATGHVARTLGIYNEGSLAISTPFEQKVVDALFAIGGLTKARRTGNNQYPKPGEIAAPRSFTGPFDRVTELPVLLGRPPG
jgi:hypothetical protein